MGSFKLSSNELALALERLATDLAPLLPSVGPLMLLGLANGGVPVARRLVPLIKARRSEEVSQGVLNPLFHRDDFANRPVPKVRYETFLPVQVHEACVVLVDDVIESGRTVRAALGELFSHGRPSQVLLAVLADRGCRSVPIHPDVCPIHLDLPENGRVRVTLNENGPDEADGLAWEKVEG